MDEKRKLVFQDRTSLSSYEINELGSLNEQIFNLWLVKRTEFDSFDSRCYSYYLKAFNDAYYVCTTVLLCPAGMLIIPHFLESQVDRPAVVFPMVHLYLSHLTLKSKEIQRFIYQLETKISREQDWGHNFSELQEAVSGYCGSIEPAIFAQRELTEEILSGISWTKITDTFKKEIIEKVVRYYARNKSVWCMMCEAIKKAAISYDYDYGFDEIEQEGWDENGPYIQTVKVPINPYDSEGNEILEPLKRAGVYEFCDNLKEKFDELVLTSVSKNIDPVVFSLTGQTGSDVEKSCFKHLNAFVLSKVKKAIDEECNDNDASLALLEQTLFDHGLLKKINQHLPFLRELLGYGLLPSISCSHQPDIELDRTVGNVRYKFSKMQSGGYKSWDAHSSDRIKCEKIGSILGPTIPYNRP